MAEEFSGTKPLTTDLKPDQTKVPNNPNDSNLSPEPNPETVEVLDTWFEEQVRKAKEKDEAGDAPGDDDAARDGDGDVTPKPTDQTPPVDDGALPSGDDGVPPDDATSSKEDFNKVELPPNSRGKSAEAFARVKELANSQINSLTQEISDLRQRVETLSAAPKEDPVTPELQEELSTLRQFKNRLDIEADPAFHKEFDGKVEQLESFILSQLRSTGKLKPEGLERIEEIGLGNVDWDDLFEKLGDPQAKRLIQARLDEIAVTKFEKQRRLDDAKKNVDEYLAGQRKAYEDEAAKHLNATTAELNTLLPKLEWLVEDDKPLPTTATPDERTVWEDNVKFKQSVKECLKEALEDRTPTMRAILVAGMAQLLKLRRDHAVLVESDKRKDAALKEALVKLDKIKKAGITRPKEGAAPPSDSIPKDKVDYTTNAGDALDALARQAGLRK